MEKAAAATSVSMARLFLRRAVPQWVQLLF